MNENLLIILILSLGGLLIRQALVLTGQNWAKSYQQTIAFLVLYLTINSCTRPSIAF